MYWVLQIHYHITSCWGCLNSCCCCFGCWGTGLNFLSTGRSGAIGLNCLMTTMMITTTTTMVMMMMMMMTTIMMMTMMTDYLGLSCSTVGANVLLSSCCRVILYSQSDSSFSLSISLLLSEWMITIINLLQMIISIYFYHYAMSRPVILVASPGASPQAWRLFTTGIII